MIVNITAIELDASIQCRAVIDTGTVAEYAERMQAGDAFPPVVLFGTERRCWIGDGWHRVMAARQLGVSEIEADVRKGDRRDALKYALGANVANGLRRTNADKRRCVEIALAEFGGLSDNAISKMCGVSNHAVKAARPVEAIGNSPNATRTTSDGRQYPATRKPAPVQNDEDDEETEHEQREVHRRPIGPPSDGMQFARIAIMNLEQIKTNDTERVEALSVVKDWITKHEN